MSLLFQGQGILASGRREELQNDNGSSDDYDVFSVMITPQGRKPFVHDFWVKVDKHNDQLLNDMSGLIGQQVIVSGECSQDKNRYKLKLTGVKKAAPAKAAA